jgi:hypothetical protein
LGKQASIEKKGPGKRLMYPSENLRPARFEVQSRQPGVSPDAPPVARLHPADYALCLNKETLSKFDSAYRPGVLFHSRIIVTASCIRH